MRARLPLATLAAILVASCSSHSSSSVVSAPQGSVLPRVEQFGAVKGWVHFTRTVPDSLIGLYYNSSVWGAAIDGFVTIDAHGVMTLNAVPGDYTPLPPITRTINGMAMAESSTSGDAIASCCTSGVTETTLPTGGHIQALSSDVHDGFLYMTRYTSGMSDGEIAKMDRNAVYTTISTTYPQVYTVTRSRDNDFWIDAGGTLVKMANVGNALTPFSWPGDPTLGITGTNDGNVWGAASGEIVEMNTTSDTVSTYPISVPVAPLAELATAGSWGFGGKDLYWMVPGSPTVIYSFSETQHRVNRTIHMPKGFNIANCPSAGCPMMVAPDGQLWISAGDIYVFILAPLIAVPNPVLVNVGSQVVVSFKETGALEFGASSENTAIASVICSNNDYQCTVTGVADGTTMLDVNSDSNNYTKVPVTVSN